MDKKIILEKRNKNNNFWKKFFIIFSLYLMISGILLDGFQTVIKGELEILTSEAILFTDNMKVGSMGGALFNCGLTTILGLLLVHITKIDIKGLTVFGLLNMAGFTFLGINPLNSIAPILGVFAYSKYKGEDFKESINIALFSGGIVAFVSYFSFSGKFSPTTGFLLGNLTGFLMGFILPPVAKNTNYAHKGHILYNVGLALGFISIVFYSFFYMLGFESEMNNIILESVDKKLLIVVLIGFILMILPKVIFDKDNISEYGKLLKEKGIAPDDFLDFYNNWTILFNMGITGIIGLIYIFLVDGNLNGFTLGPLLSMVSYGPFGLHPKNSIPIIIGVFLGGVLGRYDVSSESAIMAVFYGAGLCPIAGDYGTLAGIFTGIFHMGLATRTGVLHGGLLIYNNAFAAGFLSVILYPFFDFLKSNSIEKKNK